MSTKKIGVVHSLKTDAFLDKKFPKRIDQFWYQNGAINALKEAGFEVDMVETESLLEHGLNDKYAVLLLDNILCVNEEEVNALRQFQLNGGGIVAMFGTSARHQDGAIRPDMALSDIFHVSCGSDPATEQWNEQPFGYIIMAEDHPVTGYFKKGSKLMYSRILVPIWAPRLTLNPGGKVVATLGDFIGGDLGLPAVVVSENGKGRCVYCGPALSYRVSEPRIPQDTDNLKTLIVNMVRWSAGLV
jgi:hypothetical protein